MTKGRSPNETPLSDRGSEADRRKSTHQRAQFDSAINTSRLLGTIPKLVTGKVEVREVLQIIIEVNSSKDQSQYVAEMLAMKKEFRDLTRLVFSPAVAEFLSEGSRLVPNLTDGLASQMLMALGHAAQNDAYLETVSGSVSALLADLDHPLTSDARNYLRLLWDQMEATRKLKQTEAQYATVPISLESARPLGDEQRDSDSVAATSRRHAPESPVIAAPSDSPTDVKDSRPKHTPRAPQIQRPRGSGAMASFVKRVPVAAREREVVPQPRQTPALPRPKAIAPAVSESSPIAPLTTESARRGAPSEMMPLEPAVLPENPVDLTPSGAPLHPMPDVLEKDSQRDEFKLPTHAVPKWAIAAVIATAFVAVGVVIILTKESDEKPASPASSNSVAPGLPHASSKPQVVPSSQTVTPTPLPPTPQPPNPPSAVLPKPVVEDPPRLTPTSRTPSSKVLDTLAPNVRPSKSPTRLPPNLPASTKTPQQVPEPAPITNKAADLFASGSNKNMNPLDRIVAELRLISPDPVGIEVKARELARIIASSKRKEATRILQDLGPPIAVDPLGRDANLEESLRVFAISVLGRVATDDDDTRAVDAIFMLGEWAKDGVKGKQKAVTALQTLSLNSIVRTSAPRLNAVHTAQAEAALHN